MKKTEDKEIISSSFRDPSGFIFLQNGSIYRQINLFYKENYDCLMNSGLYRTLINNELLIPHEEINISSPLPLKAYKIIKPEPIPFISYPYEWCFSQLKDAALTLIKIQKIALGLGMTLKDASAYNIQFKKGNPILIDTLSFEKYQKGKPWIAYRQFCQHFLAPLALMSYKDVRLNQLFRIYIDGIPLDLASAFLPFRTFFVLPILSHIHLHAKSQKYFANKSLNLTSSNKMKKLNLLALIENLESVIKKLKWKPRTTEWVDYYEENNYLFSAFQEKKYLVNKFLKIINPKIIWDLGANIGLFSQIAAYRKETLVISMDNDPVCVEKNYLRCVKEKESNILPLLIDLTNPSPSIGWQNEERKSLIERGPADTILALALIHHFVFSNNLPFYKIAEFFNKTCNSLIIEFIPKSDSQVQKLLSTRKDIFPEYTQELFEKEFGKFFITKSSAKIKGSERILYLMIKK